MKTAEEHVDECDSLDYRDAIALQVARDAEWQARVDAVQAQKDTEFFTDLLKLSKEAADDARELGKAEGLMAAYAELNRLDFYGSTRIVYGLIAKTGARCSTCGTVDSVNCSDAFHYVPKLGLLADAPEAIQIIAHAGPRLLDIEHATAIARAIDAYRERNL
jgi:hypothetical protein